jgi:hypothetical protein
LLQEASIYLSSQLYQKVMSAKAFSFLCPHLIDAPFARMFQHRPFCATSLDPPGSFGLYSAPEQQGHAAFMEVVS